MAPKWEQCTNFLILTQTLGLFMAITQQDVAHIAHLAHIALTPEQTAEAAQDFGQIIQLIEQLQSVDTSGIEPLVQPLAAIQEVSLRLRADEPAPTNTIEERDALMRNAPAQSEGLFLVPTVIE